MRIVYLALGWVLGIVIENNTPSIPHAFWFYASLVSLISIFFVRQKHWRWTYFALVAVMIGGYRTSWVPTTSDVARYNGSNVAITGEIITQPDRRDDRLQIRMDVETVFDGRETYYSDGVVLVNLRRDVDVAYGDRVRVSGSLYTPGIYDRFSYADFLARQGIFSVMDDASLNIINRNGGNAFYRAIYSLRQQAQYAIEQALPSPQSALLTGILLGNERGIDDELADDFAAVGAAHVIAISGFNMALIAGIIMTSLSHITERKWLNTGAAIFIIILYTLLVGANAAVVRAAFMTSVLFVGRSLQRKTFLPASLAFVVIFMSVLHPLVLWDVGFQLSFAAVLGIAVFAEPITKWGNRWLYALFRQSSLSTRIIQFLQEPLFISLATLITTLPLTVLYFERLSPVVLIVNLLIVPVQSYLLVAGGLATLLALFVPSLAQIIFWMTMVLLSWTIGVVRAFADLPLAQVVMSVDERIIALIFITIIGGNMLQATRPAWFLRLMNIMKARSVISATLFAGIALGVLLWAISASRPDGKLHVWVLDVGHTNAILMQTPKGAQVLVDGGQYPARLLTGIGDRMPFHDRTIEVVAMTQTDIFDVSALGSVLERYEAGVILTNGQPNLAIDDSPLGDALRETNTIDVTQGYSLTFDDGVSIEVLTPKDTPALEDDINDSVMVLRVSYGTMSMLLLSDASVGLQNYLLDEGIIDGANIVQLPQNGTQRSLSEGLLDALQPQIAWLQVDNANRRGDPAGDVLSLLEAQEQLTILRTDEQGTLHLWTDGHTLWFDGSDIAQ
jgi:competence protein ComEC